MPLRDLLHPIRYIKDTIGLYDDLVYTDLVQNSTRDMVKKPSDGEVLVIDQLGTYHEDTVSFYYLFEKFPSFLHIDFKSRLRRECRGDVCITFLNRLSPHTIAWNSPEMQSKLQILSKSAQEQAEKNVNAFNIHENLGTMRKQEWIQESLHYLSSSDIDRSRALFQFSLLMVVTGTRGEDFDESIKAILAYANQLGITLTRVLYEIPHVLSYFSPWSQSTAGSRKSSYPTFTVTDEILARFNTYSQGTLGVAGICFGMDIYSSFPVLKYVKRDREDAENWLISAETGGGKSYFIKSIILQLLARKDFNGTIMDIEGFEYLPLAKMLKDELKVEVINMAEGQGGYFDPVEIPIYNDASPDEQAQMRQNSVEFSLAILRVLLGRAYQEDIYLSIVVDDAVTLTYRKNGVTDDPYTWGNSENLTLFDVYATIKTLTNYRQEEAYRIAVTKAVSLLNKYFEPGGTRSSLFSNPIPVDSIIDADLVICSFGMAGKSQSAVDEVQMALMQLGAAQLSHQRSLFSKTRKKFNFKVWEEFQRWGKFPGSEKTLGVALTGGRKLGDVNIIITNVIAEMLGEDRFNVFSNITSFLVGAIGDAKVREELCIRLSIPNMLPELNTISTVRSNKDDEKGSGGSQSIYRYSFLCGLDKSKYAITKMILPEHLAKSNLFRTGVEDDMEDKKAEVKL